MIQEQISTSSPKCLDGNAGFGVVAQTSGMAPNVARDVSMLSGYTHHFAAGDAKNPVVFLHVLRRTGGTDRHIVSRVADCGNDYSGRTNRIAHHLIVEESDLRSLSCGPVTILSQRELFRTQWNEKSQELSRGKTIPNLPISAKKCVAWERWFGDAGWGGIFAEQAEKGDPISLIFEAGTDVLPLLAEAFALLPPNARWKTTFSTFFMKSQEPPGAGKVQVKCILAGTEAEAFARLTPNTLVLDLRKQPDTAPAGKYVVAAQTGVTAQPLPIEKPIELETPSGIERKKREAAQHVAVSDREGSGENLDLTPVPVSIPGQQGTYQPSRSGKKKKKQSYFKIIAPALLVLLIAAVVGGGIYYASLVANNAAIAKAEQERKDAETKVAAEKEEQEKKEKKDAEVKAAAEKAEKNKKEAEAKAAAEQAEKDKKEAEAKAAAEQAEKDKKEAEAKAAAEKAEKDKKEAEAKTAAENEIKQQLADLPDFWEDRGLPLSSIYYPALGKEKTSFLWKIKDRVKLSVIPFVDLNKNVQPIQFDNDNKNQQISFWQEAEKDINGHPRKETIVTINLKEDGLNFEWNKSLITKNNDVESSRNLNRILLSKLKVEVEGIEKPKEIALFNPAKCNNNGTKYFTLWQQKGKEFVIYNTENASLLLDFTEWFNRDEKKSVPEPRNFQKAPYSLAYAPQTNTDLSCGLTLGDEKDLKFQISFVSKSLEPLLTNKKNIETQIKDLKKDKKNSKDKNTLENEKNTLKNQLNQLPNNQQNKERRDNLDTEIKKYEGKLNDISRIENEIRKFNEQLQQKEQEIKDEKKKWANVRIEAFSIYLLKHDIKPEEIGKPENRLLLLEVKP